jgi:hypothetical protein
MLGVIDIDGVTDKLIEGVKDIVGDIDGETVIEGVIDTLGVTEILGVTDIEGVFDGVNPGVKEILGVGLGCGGTS